MTPLLLALAVVFVSGPDRAEPGVPSGRPAWQRVGLRLKGRVLGSLVKEGATREQVVRLLGKHQSPLKPLPTYGLSGGVIFTNYIWDDLGLGVTFFSNSEATERAGPIRFAPLFDEPYPPPSKGR